MSISQTLLPEFDQEMASTRKLLALVPDDKLDVHPAREIDDPRPPRRTRL